MRWHGHGLYDAEGIANIQHYMLNNIIGLCEQQDYFFVSGLGAILKEHAKPVFLKNFAKIIKHDAFSFKDLNFVKEINNIQEHFQISINNITPNTIKNKYKQGTHLSEYSSKYYDDALETQMLALVCLLNKLPISKHILKESIAANQYLMLGHTLRFDNPEKRLQVLGKFQEQLIKFYKQNPSLVTNTNYLWEETEQHLLEQKIIDIIEEIPLLKV